MVFAADRPAAEHFICGTWVKGGSLGESFDPATGESLGDFYDADLNTVRSAISAAHTAFTDTDWRREPAQRARALNAMADAVENRSEDLIGALCRENGKIHPEAAFEVSLCAPKLRYYAALALTDLGHAAETRPGVLSTLLKEPVGVAAIITPWNSPVILSIRSLAPALAAGCTAVVKMPAQTALTNALLGQVLGEVTELPDGVVNMFTESGDLGAKELVESRLTNVVSYTGSTAVGAKIMAAAAPQIKRVSLELGGKTPMLVFDDADLDQAIPTLVAGITTFAGQFCMTGSRILVEKSVAQEVENRLVAALNDVRIGPASDHESQMGPMIDKASVERVVAALEGAQFIVRGEPLNGPGAFLRPSLVRVDDLGSPLVQNEIFGPVATFEVFDGEDQAAEKANATKFGLAASVWTRSSARADRLTAALAAGTVWINAWAQVMDAFEEGGYKCSGLGRLNGPGGLAEFQEVKHVVRSTS